MTTEETTPGEQLVQELPEELQPRLHWLCCCTVYYRIGGVTRERKVNVLTTTANQYLNEYQLMQLQQTAATMAVQNKLIPEKAEVLDVVINTASMIGYMSMQEFHKKPEVNLAEAAAEALAHNSENQNAQSANDDSTN